MSVCSVCACLTVATIQVTLSLDAATFGIQSGQAVVGLVQTPGSQGASAMLNNNLSGALACRARYFALDMYCPRRLLCVRLACSVMMRQCGHTAGCCAGQLYLTLANQGNVSGLMTTQATSCCTAPYGGGGKLYHLSA